MKFEVYKESRKMFNLIVLYVENISDIQNNYIRHTKERYISLIILGNQSIYTLIGAFYDYCPDYLNAICNMALKEGLVSKVGPLSDFDDYMQIELFLNEEFYHG